MWHKYGKTEMQTGCWWRNLNERHHLKDLGIDGRHDWINRAQKGHTCRAVVNTAMKIWVPSRMG